MFSRPRLLGSSLVIVLQFLFSSAIAQFDNKTVLLNPNSGFEKGTNGWFANQTSATVLTRDWTPGQYDGSGSVSNLNDNFFQGEKANLGQQLVRVTGSGVYGRAFAVNPTKGKHIFNAFAMKQSNQSGVAPGYASVGVTYYDANWEEVDRYEFPVGLTDTNLNRGIGDGLNFYTWGIDVPADAVNAFIYGYTSAGTSLLMDNLCIFQITNAPTASGLALNLVANPSFDTVRFTNDPTAPTCVGYGVEFWSNDRDWSRPFDGSVGSPNQAESLYQFLPLKAGATYSIFNWGSKDPAAVASFGVDLYDAHWQPIGKQVFDLTDKTGFLTGLRLEVPATCAHASLFIWADVKPPQVGTTSVRLTVYEQESTTSQATTIKGARAFPVFGRTGQIGVNVDLVMSDQDGLDLRTINGNNAQFTSKTVPGKTYPATELL